VSAKWASVSREIGKQRHVAFVGSRRKSALIVVNGENLGSALVRGNALPAKKTILTVANAEPAQRFAALPVNGMSPGIAMDRENAIRVIASSRTAI